MYVLLFDNDAPDSCCAERLLHICYPHSHISRENVRTDTHTDHTDRPTTITLHCTCSYRELMNHNSLSCVEYVHGNLEYMNPWYQRYIVHVCMLYCTDEA